MENKDKSELPIIKHTSEDKLFNYLCEIGVIPIDTEVHEIRLIVYEELGLKELSTEQIEELKVWLKSESTTLMFDYVAKNRLLEAENLKLKDELDNKDVEVLNYGMDVVPALKKEIAELKEAKAEAWDEGFKSGKNYVESSMSCDEGVRLPENPYK